MANSIKMFTNSSQGQMPMNPEMLAQRGGMNISQMLNQIRRFSSTLKGDPKQQVMSMVQQGMRSNEQLQQAMQMAQQLTRFF